MSTARSSGNMTQFVQRVTDAIAQSVINITGFTEMQFLPLGYLTNSISFVMVDTVSLVNTIRS